MHSFLRSVSNRPKVQEASQDSAIQSRLRPDGCGRVVTARSGVPAATRRSLTHMRVASRATVLIAAAMSSMAALTLAGCSSREPVDLPEPVVFEAQVLDAINAVRVGESVPRLQADECMAEHARERAKNLPGASEAVSEDLPADCGSHVYAGENLSRSDQGAAEVVATWAKNEMQYPNLVDPGFTSAGVGCVGVSFDDSTRVAEPGEELAGMACSVIFQGPGNA